MSAAKTFNFTRRASKRKAAKTCVGAFIAKLERSLDKLAVKWLGRVLPRPADKAHWSAVRAMAVVTPTWLAAGTGLVALNLLIRR